MILAGPFAPKFIAEACVASENVGEGGLGEILRLVEPKEKVRKRLGGMVCVRVRLQCRTDQCHYILSPLRNTILIICNA